MPADSSQHPGITINDSTMRCFGKWTLYSLQGLQQRLVNQKFQSGQTVVIDLDDLTEIDSAGALLLHQTINRLRTGDHTVEIQGGSEKITSLLELAARSPGTAGQTRPVEPGILESIGQRAIDSVQQYLAFLDFIGQTALAALPWLINPLRIRWRVIFHNIQIAGVNALPIVGLLAFLMGVVIAYQGGVLLKQYGASIFIADLVGLSMLRELAPLITAIIIAGRTGSAFTAQIGTMKVTEEIDALRTMGISPLEQLVLPKIIALMIALPLLTVYADILGILGGMVVASLVLDVSPSTYLTQLNLAINLENYLIGVGKAPVFAAIIASVGCFQGFRVEGSAESVGRQTTLSVVQAIFLVIVVDAVFSVVFSQVGL